jgi:uncharacterized RDD family membrane protein YckC
MGKPTNNNYAPPKSVVADVASDSGPFEKATRGSRLGATMIDGLIMTIPFIPSYAALIGGAARQTLLQPGHANVLTIWIAMAATGIWFYIGVFLELIVAAVMTVLVHRNGQTIGKKLIGIKDVRSDGSRATLGRIFWLRYFVNTLFTVIPVVGSLYAFVDILMIFGQAKRCCHDYIADTIVIRA